MSQKAPKCRNLPFCVRARRGSRVRLPKEENARSHHQRLFVENVEKTEGNRSWRIFQIRELYLRLRKVLGPLTFAPKNNNLNFRIVWNCVPKLLFLFIFEVDKSGTLAPTYPPSKRKSDLRSSFLRANQVILFTWYVVFLRHWTLKMIHFYLERKTEVLNLKILFKIFFCGQVWLCKLILALVSLLLLVNSIKKEKSQRETSDWFFCFILLKDIFWLLYYYFTSFWFPTWLRHERTAGFHFNRN